ncbi:NLR family CARD domain-containing protein 3-like [Centroberyx affinis]|uniref:NLR family CARD domain-containing protein 3-like n=1 Tax=Centroberyx affinis TaxID=166261 RepID=UPI003A5BE0FC
MKHLKNPDYNSSSVLFILDGLDESKFPLDFQRNEICRDITKTTSIDILLTNLIKGNLLHKALVWITGRPAAANQIPLGYVDRVTEVRGFNDDQKKEYFQKNISDKDMAQKIFTHIKSLRSLDIMCHIPVFCWISTTALQSLLMESQKDKEGKELPKTLTEMYTHFLIIQTKLKHQKYCQEGETDDDVIVKLGKLAFEQLNKGNLIFYADDLKNCDIDVKDAAVYSGVCTEIIRKECGLHREEMYSFVHLSVQEFLAALYVLVTFIDSGDNLLSSQTSTKVQQRETGEIPIVFLHKSAVDKALEDRYGCWDLFLRFLLGLSQKKNLKRLQGMLGRKERRLQSNQETVNYIHKMIRKVTFTERGTNLFHCLNELGDQSLVKQVQGRLDSGDLSKISPEHWSALAFVLLTSNEDLDVFELKKYFRSDDVLERLLPVLKVSKKALLGDCNLTGRCCRSVASALSSNTSGLEELDLSRNELDNSGVQLLSSGLQNPHCKLQRLRLRGCDITGEGCESLASALSLNPSHLEDLDLSRNILGDQAVIQLSDFLRNPACQLERLWLHGCGITGEGCVSLASALSLNPSQLKDLDLSQNRLRDWGVTQLSDFLRNPACQLERLWLCWIYLSEQGGAALASALSSNPSHLKQLNLGKNNLRDSGVSEISVLLMDPNCKLETLRLCDCSITGEGCVSLASALSKNPSQLKDLDLSQNRLGDWGVIQLSDFLRNPACQLERLRLCWIYLSEQGGAALASALSSNPSHLKELNLGKNDLRDTGVSEISVLLMDPNCKLETLRLHVCHMTGEGCVSLASALSLNPSHLKDLDLSWNILGDQAVIQLSDFLRNPACQLERLWLYKVNLSEQGGAALASALSSNPSHLKELDLGGNDLGDTVMTEISLLLKDPNCKLEILRLKYCSFTKGCIQSLTLALSFSSALKELDLRYNNLEDQGVELLSDWLRRPQCRLEILSLSFCTERSCRSLASALRSNPHLRELELSSSVPGESGLKLLKDPQCKLQTLTVTIL